MCCIPPLQVTLDVYDNQMVREAALQPTFIFMKDGKSVGKVHGADIAGIEKMLGVQHHGAWAT